MTVHVLRLRHTSWSLHHGLSWSLHHGLLVFNVFEERGGCFFCLYW